MGNARGLRLREALQEYIAGFAGDTGTRRHNGVNHRINDADRELVETAQGLLGRLNGDSSTDPGQRDTPGSRARDRAIPTGAPEGSSGDRARAMWPSATPAPAGNEGGASS